MDRGFAPSMFILGKYQLRKNSDFVTHCQIILKTIINLHFLIMLK